MALEANSMFQSIRDRMTTLPPDNRDSTEAQNKFAEGISSYLEDNMEIQFTWVAQTGTVPPVIDSTVLMRGKISFPSFTLTPPGDGGLQAWADQLYSQVLTGVITPVKGAISSPGDYFVIPSNTLGAVLWSPLVKNNETVFEDGMINFCEQIIERIKTMIQTTSFIPASHFVSGITYTASVCQMVNIL